MSAADKNWRNEDFCQKYPLLIKHLEAVHQYNEITNLTSIKDLEAGKVLHIEDSLAVLQELNEAPAGSLADIGSGAGFPGIPLALVSGRTTTLIESNNKKARFLNTFIEQESLQKLLSVASVRTEELAQQQETSFAVITARAVASLPSLLELATPLLSKGGHFIALKGRLEEEEELKGKEAERLLGLSLIKKRVYHLGDDGAQRCVLVYEKQGDAQIKLPRRPGMATKRPLA